MAYTYLFIAILCETIGTLSLKASGNFTKLIPTLLVIAGYGTAFYLLSLVMQSLPVGTTYAIWSGVGIVLISLAGYFVFGQKLDFAALAGMGLILAGVLVINLFSNASPH
jgi:small multidrug resistance pump